MSESTKKYLEIVAAASEIAEPKESIGDKIKGGLKTIFKELYDKRKEENLARLASQQATIANKFNSIQNKLDSMYDSFPSAELDKVNKIGMDAFLNNYAEEQFNNTDWSQQTGIKWADRTNLDRVNTADQEHMLGLFGAIKTQKKDHIERMQQDLRAQMEKTEFSQAAVNAKIAAENMVKADPKNKFVLPFISRTFDKVFGDGSSAYTDLQQASKKSTEDLVEFLKTVEGLDEKITFDYGAIINDTQSSDEEKANMIRNRTTPISASSIETKTLQLESRLYRTDTNGKKIVREEVKEMIKKQPLIIPLIRYDGVFTIEDFKKIEADQPQTSVSFNFYKKFIDNDIKVLNPDGTLSTSSNEQFLNIVAKNILERQKRAVANRDENATMLLGTAGLNTVIASFANEGRFVLGSNIIVNENAISPDLKIEDGDIVFISPSLNNRINKDKISANEIIDSKSEEESSDGFDRAGFTDSAITAISNGEIKGYQAVMLKAHPEHTAYINKTVNTLLDLTKESTKTNNLAAEMQDGIPTNKSDISTNIVQTIASNLTEIVGDFFKERAKEADFAILQRYVEGNKTFVQPRTLEKLFIKYNLGQNASEEKVKKFLEEQKSQN